MKNLKLKPIYENRVITRQNPATGSTIRFDTSEVKPELYPRYFKSGFEDVFESVDEVEIKNVGKTQVRITDNNPMEITGKVVNELKPEKPSLPADRQIGDGQEPRKPFENAGRNPVSIQNKTTKPRRKK